MDQDVDRNKRNDEETSSSTLQSQRGGKFQIGSGNTFNMQDGNQQQNFNVEQNQEACSAGLISTNISTQQAPPQHQPTNPTWTMENVISSDHRRFLRKLSLNREFHRITSFARWPTDCSNVPPAALAKTGFFYLGDMDRTQCFSCGVVLKNWSLQGQAALEHRIHCNQCRMVTGTETRNIPIPDENETQGQLAVDYPLRFQKNPLMREQAHREQTFDRRWPAKTIPVTPAQLAEAGFFYLGESDQVKCWYCNGGLHNWELDDIPWEGHSMWFPYCQFLLRTKGERFVSQHLIFNANLARSIIARQDGSPLNLVGSLQIRFVRGQDIPPSVSVARQRSPTPPPTTIDPQVGTLLIDRMSANKQDNLNDIYGTVPEFLNDVMKKKDEIRQEEEERREQTSSIFSNHPVLAQSHNSKMDHEDEHRNDVETSSSTLQSQHGGDESVTNVVAIKGRCPWREILVSWTQPVTLPQGYQLKFYEVEEEKNSKQLVEIINFLEQTQLSQRFVELKSSTTYICEVISRYDGEPKVGSFSNLEVTDERVASATETLNDFGKPEHIMHTKKKGQNNDLIIELSWSKINLGENYKITGYHMKVESHRLLVFFPIVDFDANLPVMSTHVDVVNLRRGQKYVVRFTTEYIDYDDRFQKIKKTKTHSFCTRDDESVTNLVAIKDRCSWREILVTWTQPVTPPQGYQLNFYEVEEEKYSKQLVESINFLEQTQLSQRFVELKSKTTYICEVIPRYDDEPNFGKFSNREVTDERVASATETLKDFGQPKHIMHLENGDDNDDLMVKLSWSNINIGENYKITGYYVKVHSNYHNFFPVYRNFSLDYMVFQAQLQPITTHVDVDNLKRGQNYVVRFTTKYTDLDDRYQIINTTKTYSFCTIQRQPSFTNCELKNGVITISWELVHKAMQYRLVIKDEILSENIVEDEVIPGTESKVKIQTTEKLCIGRTCMIKIITSVNNLNVESEWKAYLVGGKLVPRNVEASTNSDNPERSIRVTFDAPKQGPVKEYKIAVVPEFGKKKKFFCSSNTVLVEYLRKGIKYKFMVFAKHGEEWSDGSISNSQETDKDDNHHPVISFQNISGSKFDLQGAQFTGYATTVNVNKGKDFGKVRDLSLVPVNEKQPNKKEILKISWKAPSFDNNASDYKVEKYKVEIKKINSFEPKEEYLKFEKNIHEYCTENQEFELGETYNISVSTIYIDIDQDEEYISYASEKEMQTRPCQPTGVKCNVKTKDSGKDYLRIEWNFAKEATYYTVEIHTDESEQLEPLFKQNVEKLTEWERIFDDLFGYGTSYHAVITAIGNENKANSIRTDRATIGGDFAPKKVQATVNHIRVVDPNTQVYLSWESPAQQPKSYEVTFENEGKKLISCSNSELLIRCLRAGEWYTFKVVAIHKQHEKKSGACVSNRIQTNPTPTQVKNVQTFPGHNRSTSINISWDKVDAENEEKSTKYRVNVKSLDEKLRREINVADNFVIVDGLLSGTNYFITVAGGNSIGFGKDSKNAYFKTELGTPKNVHLFNNVTSPDTSLKLQFSEAEGKPVNYLGAFNKYENQGKHEDLVFINVQSGHIFNDLEPNTRYNAMVLAVFGNEIKGKAVKSGVLITAPSKPMICESRCCNDNKIASSKNLFLKWKSDSGCKEHEIKIKHGDKVESQQIIENRTELRYSCMHKASRYIAQIRTKNITFGQWSDEAVIDLAPVKLKNIQAELDQESNNILIQCKKEAKNSLFYYCQALCSEKSSGEPVLMPTHDENIVKFTFMPILHAEKYSFKLWAVDGKGVVGESSLSPYVISRPAKGQITKVERNDENPSTDIDIIWDALERCDEYEIQIKTRGEQKFETCARSADTSFNYKCKNPGKIYVVCVRGIRESVRGNLSDKVIIGLAPGQVELIEDRDAQEPVETVQVEWTKLKTKPEGYRVILFNERKEKIASETETEFTHHVFKKLAKPGSLCYCTVAAYNTTGEGKSTKSQNYRIKWNTPKLVVITPDENNPSRRAKISWERPHGVTCFRLELENNLSSTVITHHLDDTNYIFESGIPGNSYTIRLYSGCDGRYDVRPVRTAMVMIPEPPTSIICEANSHIKGIVVTFKDNSNMKNSYEICAESLSDPMIRIVLPTEHVKAELPNLIPGEFYKVSLVTVCKTVKSQKVFYSGYIQTYPDNIKNLRHEFQDGCIIYKWGSPEIAPDEYIVQWRVNNEPMNEDTTTETKFKIDSIKRNQKYKVRIAASNTAGKSKMEILETTIPADETTVALSECKQIEPNKKVHDCVEEILSNKDNPVREDEICTILRDSVSATKPRNVPQGDQDWTSIEEWTSFSIKYKRKSCYRKGSKVFNAIRESGGGEEEIIVKFVPDFNTVNIREIDSLWATIGHENVVKYLQSGYCKFENEKSIFIAMEKCDKDTLFEKIEAGNLAYAVRKSTVYCIAKGLQHLKEKGIVHRDLKPQNILYRVGVPVISDFGLSKRISLNKSHTHQSRQNVGTEGWRAPETSMEKGKCTFAGDIYSAGLVKFYALTNGKHPFGEDTGGRQYLINNYPDDKYRTRGMERSLKVLKEVGVLDWTIATDMINLMLNTEPNDRPTIEAVLENPFFWTVKKRLNFFTDTHKCIEHVNPSQSEITIFSELNKREGKYGNQIKDEMENWENQSGEKGDKNLRDQSGKKEKKHWKEKLSFTVDEMKMIQDNFAQQNIPDLRVDKDAMMRKAKKCKDSVTELLRFIRNRYTHMKEDIKEGTINQSEEQFLTYFFDRFPHLFVYVYCTIKDNYYGESKSENCCTDILAKYFPLLEPKIILNEVDNSLKINWEPVICANYYELEIYTNNSDQKQPVFKKDVGKKTEWAQAFDDKFGYGTSYYAVVTAVGDENKRSSACTKQEQIGGDGDKKNSTCTDQKQIGGDGDKRSSNCTDQRQIGK